MGTKQSPQDARSILPAGIKWCVYAFDGVMTDDRVIVIQTGEEAVICSRADGLAVGLIRQLGIEQFILTTEGNPVVKRRAAKLGLPCVGGLDDKAAGLQQIADRQGMDLRRTLYVGNDVNDIEAMLLCGLKICPADAHPSVREIADMVTAARGGEGVIRELYDVLQGAAVVGR